MAEQNVAGVLSLLDKLSTLDPAKIVDAAKAREQELIRSIEPAPELLHPAVPDFVSDHIGLKAGGHKVPYTHSFDAWGEEKIYGVTGPSGTGKTTLIMSYVDMMNAADLAHNRKVWERNKARLLAGGDVAGLEPYRMIKTLKIMQGSEETRSAELIGEAGLTYDEAGNRHIVEMLGAGVEAYTLGLPLLVDELDAIPSGVNAACHGLFDRNSRVVHLWLNGRREFRRHADYSVSFTMNTKGFGENAAEYGHAQTQSRAFFTRVPYMVEMDYLPVAAERDLVMARVPEVPVAAVHKMCEAAARIRKAYVGGAIDLVVSTREIEAWARETRRAMRRGAGFQSDEDLWKRFVVPAAGPTLCTKTADQGTAEAVMKELSWR